MYPGNPRGCCHWFVNGKCAIHELGKPYECARSHHSLSLGTGRANHKRAADAWRPKEHQDMIVELYGEEPEADNSLDSIGSIFGW